MKIDAVASGMRLSVWLEDGGIIRGQQTESAVRFTAQRFGTSLKSAVPWTDHISEAFALIQVSLECYLGVIYSFRRKNREGEKKSQGQRCSVVNGNWNGLVIGARFSATGHATVALPQSLTVGDVCVMCVLHVELFQLWLENTDCLKAKMLPVRKDLAQVRKWRGTNGFC